MRTLTVRGLRWVGVSLALALGANLISLVFFLVTIQGSGFGDIGTWNLVLGLWSVLLFGSAVPGFLGFWRMQQGRREHSSRHDAKMRWASVAFVIGAGSAIAYFLSGIVLSTTYIPETYYYQGTVTLSPLGWLLRTTHVVAPVLLMVSVGLFLLLTVWRLGTGLSRWVAIGAFLLSILAVALGAPNSMYGLPPTLWDVAAALPALSSGLWLAASLLVTTHLRGIGPRAWMSPATT